MFVANSQLVQAPRFATDWTLTSWLQIKKNVSVQRKKERKKTSPLTPSFGLAQVGTNFSRARADHAETLRLVKGADFFLCLTEGHTIRQLSELRLRVCLLSFTSAGFRGWCVRNGPEPGWQKKGYAPFATTALLGAVIRYGQRLHNLGWWGSSQPIKLFLDLFSELGPITAYTTKCVSQVTRDQWGRVGTDLLSCFVPNPFGQPKRTWHPQFAAA